jgi:hypothetical protein
MNHLNLISNDNVDVQAKEDGGKLDTHADDNITNNKEQYHDQITDAETMLNKVIYSLIDYDHVINFIKLDNLQGLND